MPARYQRWGPYKSEFIYFEVRERLREIELYLDKLAGWLADLVPRGSFKDKAIYLFIVSLI